MYVNCLGSGEWLITFLNVFTFVKYTYCQLLIIQYNREEGWGKKGWSKNMAKVKPVNEAIRMTDGECEEEKES